MDKTTLGIVFMTVSTILYSLLSPYLKKAGLNPFATIIVQVGFLWLSILPFFLSTKSYQGLLDNKEAFFILAIMGVVNAIGFYLIVRSYDLLPVWQINMFSLLTPLIGGVIAYFVLGEAISSKLFLGLIFMTIGMIVAFR